MINAITVLVAATFVVHWGNGVLFGGGLSTSILFLVSFIFFGMWVQKESPSGYANLVKLAAITFLVCLALQILSWVGASVTLPIFK